MEESNGSYSSERLDRIEKIVEVLAGVQMQYRDEHQMLLKSQVLMAESITKLAEAQKVTEQRLNALAERVDTVTENMNALIKIVDGMIRKEGDSR